MKYKQRFFAPDGYTPRFYPYIRVSHKSQHDRRESPESQEQEILAYYQFKKLDPASPVSRCELGKCFIEPLAKSAYTCSLARRPAGAELVEIIQPGDHIAVTKFDRIFRDLEDFSSRRRWFAERGVTLHLVNFMGAAIDTESVAGQMMLGNLAIWAEVESMMISDRVSRARSSLRAKGRHGGTRPPFFMRCVDTEPGKKYGGRLVFQEWAEPMMEKAAYLYDVEKMSFLEIARHFHKKERPIGDAHVERLYWFWRAWNAAGRPDINTLKVRDFIDKFKKESRNGT